MESRLKNMENIEDLSDPESLKNFVDENYHRIRECKEYKTEYNSCSSIQGRFHQYFIFGETMDCNELKTKYKDCDKCVYKNDWKACANLIQMENKRREERLKAHFENDTWSKRTEPPPRWNAPLPDWADEKAKESFITMELYNACVIS